MRQHFDRFAAEDDCRNAATSVRRHRNEVTALRFGRIDDRLVRMPMLKVNSLTHYAHRVCCIGNSIEKFCSGLPERLCVLSLPVPDGQRHQGKEMKRPQDSEHRYFGAYRLGQGYAVLETLLSEFRAVGRYQYIFVYGFLLHRTPALFRERAGDICASEPQWVRRKVCRGDFRPLSKMPRNSFTLPTMMSEIITRATKTANRISAG